MALDSIVSEIPEGFEEHYVERDGQFHLDIIGAEDTTALRAENDSLKGKVTEFRNNNTKLMKQVADKGGKVEDFNVDIDAAIEDALSPIKEANAKLLENNQALEKSLTEVVLSDRVKDIAIKNGVHESALPDVVSRAKAIFTVKDGKPIPANRQKDSEGNTMSPESWLKDLTTDAPHLFKASNGGGAQRPAGGHIQQNMSSNDKIAAGLANKFGK